MVMATASMDAANMRQVFTEKAPRAKECRASATIINIAEWSGSTIGVLLAFHWGLGETVVGLRVLKGKVSAE